MKASIFSIILIFLSFSRIESQLQIVEAFPNLSFQSLIDIQNANDGSNRLFAVEQPGVIYVFDNDPQASYKNIFLDISNRVSDGGEMGLLGLAFHPQFSDSNYFYVNYTKNSPRRTIIARFAVPESSPNTADPNSELILLEVNQPFSNHNGGQTSFGPDGYLYISFGDGGSGGDPQNNGQDRTTILGSIIRIDVNKKDPDLNYSIPADNPFYQNLKGYAEEIWVYGLRNTWRFSFDSETGMLWAGDVGQNLWEEINIIEKGKNYGWRITEGNHCYNPSTNCDFTGLELPIWEYDHSSSGGFSVTGGFVYRGSSASELTGKYIYGDYVNGNMWALSYDGNEAENEFLFNTPYNISSFGVDEQNELYFADYGGKIFKFEGEPVTGIEEIKLNNYRLYQNFPNPFNPDTNIEFHIGNSEFVDLTIFDMLGNEITTLVQRRMVAGNHQISFNAENLASGMYIYRLSTPEFSQSKTMMLLK
jgi:hypothetical protein